MAKEGPRPGSWHDAPLGTFSQDGVVNSTLPAPEYQEPKPAKPEVSKSLVGAFKAFHKSPFGQAERINRIYYPSCGLDISPSTGFPHANVIYADIDVSAKDKIHREGYFARNIDATAWVPAVEMDMV